MLAISVTSSSCQVPRTRCQPLQSLVASCTDAREVEDVSTGVQTAALPLPASEATAPPWILLPETLLVYVFQLLHDENPLLLLHPSAVSQQWRRLAYEVLLFDTAASRPVKHPGSVNRADTAGCSTGSVGPGQLHAVHRPHSTPPAAHASAAPSSCQLPRPRRLDARSTLLAPEVATAAGNRGPAAVAHAPGPSAPVPHLGRGAVSGCCPGDESPQPTTAVPLDSGAGLRAAAVPQPPSPAAPAASRGYRNGTHAANTQMPAAAAAGGAAAAQAAATAQAAAAAAAALHVAATQHVGMARDSSWDSGGGEVGETCPPSSLNAPANGTATQLGQQQQQQQQHPPVGPQPHQQPALRAVHAAEYAQPAASSKRLHPHTLHAAAAAPAAGPRQPLLRTHQPHHAMHSAGVKQGGQQQQQDGVAPGVAGPAVRKRAREPAQGEASAEAPGLVAESGALPGRLGLGSFFWTGCGTAGSPLSTSPPPKHASRLTHTPAPPLRLTPWAQLPQRSGSNSLGTVCGGGGGGAGHGVGAGEAGEVISGVELNGSTSCEVGAAHCPPPPLPTHPAATPPLATGQQRAAREVCTIAAAAAAAAVEGGRLGTPVSGGDRAGPGAGAGPSQVPRTATRTSPQALSRCTAPALRPQPGTRARLQARPTLPAPREASGGLAHCQPAAAGAGAGGASGRASVDMGMATSGAMGPWAGGVPSSVVAVRPSAATLPGYGIPQQQQQQQQRGVGEEVGEASGAEGAGGNDVVLLPGGSPGCQAAGQGEGTQGGRGVMAEECTTSVQAQGCPVPCPASPHTAATACCSEQGTAQGLGPPQGLPGMAWQGHEEDEVQPAASALGWEVWGECDPGKAGCDPQCDPDASVGRPVSSTRAQLRVQSGFGEEVGEGGNNCMFGEEEEGEEGQGELGEGEVVQQQRVPQGLRGSSAKVRKCEQRGGAVGQMGGRQLAPGRCVGRVAARPQPEGHSPGGAWHSGPQLLGLHSKERRQAVLGNGGQQQQQQGSWQPACLRSGLDISSPMFAGQAVGHGGRAVLLPPAAQWGGPVVPARQSCSQLPDPHALTVEQAVPAGSPSVVTMVTQLHAEAPCLHAMHSMHGGKEGAGQEAGQQGEVMSVRQREPCEAMQLSPPRPPPSSPAPRTSSASPPVSSPDGLVGLTAATSTHVAARHTRPPPSLLPCCPATLPSPSSAPGASTPRSRPWTPALTAEALAMAVAAPELTLQQLPPGFPAPPCHPRTATHALTAPAAEGGSAESEMGQVDGDGPAAVCTHMDQGPGMQPPPHGSYDRMGGQHWYGAATAAATAATARQAPAPSSLPAALQLGPLHPRGPSPDFEVQRGRPGTESWLAGSSSAGAGPAMPASPSVAQAVGDQQASPKAVGDEQGSPKAQEQGGLAPSMATAVGLHGRGANGLCGGQGQPTRSSTPGSHLLGVQARGRGRGRGRAKAGGRGDAGRPGVAGHQRHGGHSLTLQQDAAPQAAVAVAATGLGARPSGHSVYAVEVEQQGEAAGGPGHPQAQGRGQAAGRAGHHCGHAGQCDLPHAGIQLVVERQGQAPAQLQGPGTQHHRPWLQSFESQRDGRHPLGPAVGTFSLAGESRRQQQQWQQQQPEGHVSRLAGVGGDTTGASSHCQLPAALPLAPACGPVVLQDPTGLMQHSSHDPGPAALQLQQQRGRDYRSAASWHQAGQPSRHPTAVRCSATAHTCDGHGGGGVVLQASPPRSPSPAAAPSTSVGGCGRTAAPASTADTTNHSINNNHLGHTQQHHQYDAAHNHSSLGQHAGGAPGAAVQPTGSATASDASWGLWGNSVQARQEWLRQPLAHHH